MKNYNDIKNDLNVTEATIRNWVKTGVIPYLAKDEFFSLEQYNSIMFDVKSKYGKLKSRVNRNSDDSHQLYSALYNSNSGKFLIKSILSFMIENDYELNQIMFAISLISLEQKGLVSYKLGRENIKISSESKTLTAFLNKWKNSLSDFEIKLFKAFPVFEVPNDEKDFLGRIYESLRTVADRSQAGAYFTPQAIVQDLSVDEDLRVFDPCAGTGSIVLSVISNSHNPRKIFLQDVDQLALNIAMINFVLYFNNVNDLINVSSASALVKDSFSKSQFDVIITNPPYGAKLSQSDKAALQIEYPDLSTSETFSIVLFNSLKRLRKNKRLIFILPESILYVSTHHNIRNYIFSKNYRLKIQFFGKAFKGVMSNIIRLEVTKGKKACFYKIDNKEIHVPNELIKLNGNIPPYVYDETEIKILEDVFKAETFTLSRKCEFGLGIVTGNNSSHLLIKGKRKKAGEENIYTGKELQKFRFLPAKYHIDYSPENLQQVAPLRKYRSPKICYSFISNSLRTLYDIDGSLVLNSINFFIIQDSNISAKALSAFLNSSIASFLYQKMFNSTKVLKSHLEKIPIPVSFFDKTNELENIYDLGAKGEDVQNQLDILCKELFNNID